MAAPDFSTDEVLIHAGSLLNKSGHPLEEAVLALAQAHQIPLLAATYVDPVAGLGLVGRVNGKICVLGKESLMAEAGIDIACLQTEPAILQQTDRVHYFLSIGDHLAGMLVK